MSATNAQAGRKNSFGSAMSLLGTISDVAGDTLDKGHKVLATADKALVLLSGSQAFRRTARDAAGQVVPVLNRAGTLQGMVVSRCWRGFFNLAVKYAKPIEDIGKVADGLAWMSYITGWAEEIDRAWQSNEPWDVKGPKLCLYGTTALMKTLIGTAHGITDVTLYAAQGACMAGSRVGVAGMPSVSQCSSYADIARAEIGVGFLKEEAAVSPESLYHALSAAEAATGMAALSTSGKLQAYFSQQVR